MQCRVASSGPEPVEATFAHIDRVHLLRLGHDLLWTTEDHPFWSVTDARFERADELDVGELVLGQDGVVRVTGALQDSNWRMSVAYNLGVRDIHTFRVGSSSVLVHNTCPIHGNSAGSPKPAFLYRLYDRVTGEYLKTGISQAPSRRYSSTFLEGKRMEVLTSGPRREILNLERYIVERDPGRLNRERWAGDFLSDVPPPSG